MNMTIKIDEVAIVEMEWNVNLIDSVDQIDLLLISFATNQFYSCWQWKEWKLSKSTIDSFEIETKL